MIERKDRIYVRRRAARRPLRDAKEPCATSSVCRGVNAAIPGNGVFYFFAGCGEVRPPHLKRRGPMPNRVISMHAGQKSPRPSVGIRARLYAREERGKIVFRRR